MRARKRERERDAIAHHYVWFGLCLFGIENLRKSLDFLRK